MTRYYSSIQSEVSFVWADQMLRVTEMLNVKIWKVVKSDEDVCPQRKNQVKIERVKTPSVHFPPIQEHHVDPDGIRKFRLYRRNHFPPANSSSCKMNVGKTRKVPPSGRNDRHRSGKEEMKRAAKRHRLWRGKREHFAEWFHPDRIELQFTAVWHASIDLTLARWIIC